MDKVFVPYQVALKLKQIGFNEECFAYYTDFTPSGEIELTFKINYKQVYDIGPFIEMEESIPKTVKNEDFAAIPTAPLWQDAFRWLCQMINLDETEWNLSFSDDGWSLNHNYKTMDSYKGNELSIMKLISIYES